MISSALSASIRRRILRRLFVDRQEIVFDTYFIDYENGTVNTLIGMGEFATNKNLTGRLYPVQRAFPDITTLTDPNQFFPQYHRGIRRTIPL